MMTTTVATPSLSGHRLYYLASFLEAYKPGTVRVVIFGGSAVGVRQELEELGVVPESVESSSLSSEYRRIVDCTEDRLVLLESDLLLPEVVRLCLSRPSGRSALMLQIMRMPGWRIDGPKSMFVGVWKALAIAFLARGGVEIAYLEDRFAATEQLSTSVARCLSGANLSPHHEPLMQNELDRCEELRQSSNRKKKTVLLTGVIAQRKNPLLFINACETLDDFDVELVGPVDSTIDEADIDFGVARLESAGRRVFRDSAFQSEDALIERISQASALALLHDQNLPSALMLRSALLGTPVVCLTSSPFADFVQQNRLGYLAEPNAESVAKALRLAVELEVPVVPIEIDLDFASLFASTKW